MKLWLVRHAPPCVPAGVCYGRTDLPAGEAATADIARALAVRLPRGLAVRTSPSLRCRTLADALHALRPDLPIIADERLQELDFGTWEMRAWDDIGPHAMAAWTADFAQHQPGGGESVRQLLARVAAAFDEACARSAGMLWITHAGVIRAARLLLSGVRQVDTAAQWPAQGIPFGSIEVHDLPARGPLSAAPATPA